MRIGIALSMPGIVQHQIEIAEPMPLPAFTIRELSAGGAPGAIGPKASGA